jgi:flagellar export protein FliJ
VPKRKRLESLKDLAANDEADAARRLASSGEEIRARQADLDRLRAYMNEYRAAVENPGGVDADRWRNLRQFMQSLSEAIGEREREFEQLLTRRERELEHWRRSRGRTQAFDKLLDLHDREVRRIREQREQKELDERNGQRGG